MRAPSRAMHLSVNPVRRGPARRGLACAVVAALVVAGVAGASWIDRASPGVGAPQTAGEVHPAAEDATSAGVDEAGALTPADPATEETAAAFSVVDDELAADVERLEGSPAGADAVFLADGPALSDPAFQLVAAHLTALGGGLYRGPLTADDMRLLSDVQGLKVSADRPLAIEPVGGAEALTDQPVAPTGSAWFDLTDAIATVPEVDPLLAPTRTQLGLQGAGQVIAIIDTGIDTAALGLAGKVVHREDFSAATAACSDNGFLDPVGHGTHVASIAAGAVTATDPTVTGVAPQAALIDVRVFNCAREATTAQVDQALAWILANHAARNISVVNVSLSSGSTVLDGTDTTSVLVDRLVAAGVFVSVAAGNTGDEPSTIAAPATAQFATTVGSAGVNRYGAFLSPFSSQGPTTRGVGIDLLAAGSSIRAANSTANGSSDTVVFSGTSMAAPYVAGLAALLHQKAPAHAPSGTVCDIGASCPEGVVAATMQNPLEADMVASDWFAAGPDPMSGRGLVSAADSLRGTAAPPAQSLDVTLDGESPNMLEVPAHAEPATVTIVTETSTREDAWSHDTFEYTVLDSSGLTSAVQVPCGGITQAPSFSCETTGIVWTKRVWRFYLPPTAETSWLRLAASRSVDAAVTAPGLSVPIKLTNGLRAGDVAMDASGHATVVVERTEASGVASILDIAPSGGLVAPQSVVVPAGPAGTTAPIEVSTAPGFVPVAPATNGRLALSEGSSLRLVASVQLPPQPDLPGMLTVGGLPLTSGALSEITLLMATDGTILGESHQPLLLRGAAAQGYLTGPFVVEPGSNDAQQIPITQTSLSAISAIAISGDGNTVVLSEFPAGSGIVPGDGDSRTVVFALDRSTGVATEINSSTCSINCWPALSHDGRAVAYVAPTAGGQTLYWQGGDTYEETRVVATFAAEDSLRVEAVTDEAVLVEVVEAGADQRWARLYTIADDSFVDVAQVDLAQNESSSLSDDGSAVAFISPYGQAVGCYRIADGERVVFDSALHPPRGSIAAGDDCTYVIGVFRSEPGSLTGASGSELVRLLLDGSRTILATRPRSSDEFPWAFDATGTHVITATGIPLSPGDTNGLTDFYRGTWSGPAVSPLVDRVEPPSGSGGSLVTLRGSGFTGATAVTFGGVAGTGVEVVSASELVVTAPAHAAGAVPVVVVTPGGSSLPGPGAVFTYVRLVTQSPVRALADWSVAPEGVRCVSIAGTSGVPTEATGVVMNVTTVRPNGPGYVVVYPDTAGNGATAAPGGSTVNFEPGADVANSAFVALPADGKVCYFTRGASSVGVLMDVTGYTLAGSGITLQASTRLLDTRAGGDHVGEVTGPVAPRQTYTVQVAGVAGVPADAAAVLLNVTVTGATTIGNLRVFPGGQAVPNTSVINFAAGQAKANATIVALVDGKVSFYSDSPASVAVSPVQVILDVVGYVHADSAYTGVSPTRVMDTRPGSRVGPIGGPLAARVVYSLPLAGVGPVPAGATAVVLNVTAIGPSGNGNLRVYPDSDGTGLTAPPNASAINYIPGRDIPNQVVVALPANGRVNFYSDMGGGTVHLAADVVGYITGGAPD